MGFNLNFHEDRIKPTKESLQTFDRFIEPGFRDLDVWMRQLFQDFVLDLMNQPNVTASYSARASDSGSIEAVQILGHGSLHQLIGVVTLERARGLPSAHYRKVFNKSPEDAWADNKRYLSKYGGGYFNDIPAEVFFGPMKRLLNAIVTIHSGKVGCSMEVMDRERPTIEFRSRDNDNRVFLTIQHVAPKITAEILTPDFGRPR